MLEQNRQADLLDDNNEKADSSCSLSQITPNDQKLLQSRSTCGGKAPEDLGFASASDILCGIEDAPVEALKPETKPRSEDKSQHWNDRIGGQFFNAGPEGRHWNGNFEGLKDTLAEARKALSPDEFKALCKKIEEGTGGAFSHTEKDGKVDEMKLRDTAVFRESWETAKSQRWNDCIGGQFFNAGPEGRHWNGNFEGLKDTLAEARKALSPDEFKALCKKIEEGTGGAFSHTEKDGKVDEMKFRDTAVFRESWETEKSQRWNDRIGGQFFNGGPFSGDYKGLSDVLIEARKKLTSEEFSSLVDKIERGTGGFFKHTSKEGAVDVVSIGDGIDKRDLCAQPHIDQDPKLGRVQVLEDGRRVYLDRGDEQPAQLSKVVWAERGMKFSHVGELVAYGGGLKNDSDKAIAYLAKDANGKEQVYVLQPHTAARGDIDVDAVVMDPRYQPVLGADGKWHPVEIPPGLGVLKIPGGSSATLGSDGETWTHSRSASYTKVAEFTGGAWTATPASQSDYSASGKAGDALTRTLVVGAVSPIAGLAYGAYRLLTD